MRAIARVAANPRVDEYLRFADPIFTEQASTLPYDAFVAWLRDWVALAEADGAARDDEISHERRRLSMVENFDGSWSERNIELERQGRERGWSGWSHFTRTDSARRRQAR